MSEPLIGSVGVGVTPDARDFWEKFQEQTKRDTDKGVEVRVGADTRDAKADIDALRAEAEAEAINIRVKTDTGNGSNDTGLLLKSLIPLAPALVPLAGAALAGGAALTAMGLSGVLAVKGIETEMADGTVTGQKYAGVLATLKGGAADLEHTATVNFLAGTEASAAKLTTLLPSLNVAVAQSSAEAGSITSHVAGALVSGFSTFAPVINEVEGDVDRLAGRFETWANGSGGEKFAGTLYSDFKQVAPVLGELATTAVHLVEAFAPSGTGALSEIQLFSTAINAVPVGVLKAATTAFIAFKAATAVSAGLKAGTAALTEFATAEKGAAAGADALAGGALSRSAAGLASLTTRVAPYAVGVVAADFAVQSLIKTNNSWSQSNNVVESTIGNIGTELKTLAGGHVLDFLTGANVSKNLDARDLANQIDEVGKEYASLLPYATQYANIQAELAEPYAVDNMKNLINAQNALNLSLSKTPISQATAQYASLSTALANNAAAEQKWLTQGTNTGKQINGVAIYTKTWSDALAASDGNQIKATDLIMSHADALTQDQQQAQLTVVQQAALNTAVGDASSKYKLTTSDLDLYSSAIGVTSDELADGTISSAQFTAEIGLAKKAIDDGSSATTGWIAALATFNSSADTAADRGALIGAALKAANGPLLDYAGTMVSAASANQSLVNAFNKQTRATIDLKTGTIDLKNAAAAPLITGLEQLQSTTEAAAAATYQFELHTRGGTQAAKDAYLVYKNDTQGALIDEASKLGLTHGQAKKLADTYFNLADAPGIKKQIELAGKDDVTPLLTGILRDLDKLVADPHVLTVTANTQPAETAIEAMLAQPLNLKVNVTGLPTVDGGAALSQILGASENGTYPTAPPAAKPKAPASTGKGGHGTDTVSAHLLTASKPKGSTEPGGFTGVTGPAPTSGTSTSSSAATSTVNLGSAAATLRTFVNDAFSSSSTLLAAGSQLLAAAKSVHVSAAQYKILAAEDATLVKETQKRDKDAAALATAKSNEANVKAAASDAITGSFDVTTAGASATGTVTGGALLAQETQAANKATLFVADMKKLAPPKLNKAYWQQLAQAGPAALPQVEALLSLSAGQLHEANVEEATIQSTATSFGTYAGTDLYGAQVTKLTAQVHADDATIVAQVVKMGDKLDAILHALGAHQTVIDLDGKTIARAVAKANKQYGTPK